MKLPERAREVRDVVQDRVPENEVEAAIRERKRLGLRDNGRHLEPELLGAGSEPLEHPGRDVGRGRALDQPELQQVEREVPGAGPDLERIRERSRGLAAERLDQLRAHLALADLAVVDAPLGVVGRRRRIVIPRVRVLDLGGRGGRRGGHRRG